MPREVVLALLLARSLGLGVRGRAAGEEAGEMIEIYDGNDGHHRDNVVVVKFKIARCLGTDAAVRRHPNIDLLIRLIVKINLTIF